MPQARRRAHLSLAEARRIALAAQGFADRPLGREVDVRALRTRVLARTRLLQIDSVNVLERAHYLPAFSRLGPYDRGLLDRLSAAAPRRLFEYWGHEASLLPVELWPLLQWRMARVHDDAWGGMRRIAVERPELVAAVLADIAARGPLRASPPNRICATTFASLPASPSSASPSSWKPGSCCLSASRGGARRPTSRRMRGCRAASTRARSSARSTR